MTLDLKRSDGSVLRCPGMAKQKVGNLIQKSMIQRKAFSCLFQLAVSQKKHLAMLLLNHGLS